MSQWWNGDGDQVRHDEQEPSVSESWFAEDARDPQVESSTNPLAGDPLADPEFAADAAEPRQHDPEARPDAAAPAPVADNLFSRMLSSAQYASDPAFRAQVDEMIADYRSSMRRVLDQL